MIERNDLSLREKVIRVQEENPVMVRLVGLGVLAFVNVGLMSLGEKGVKTAQVLDTLVGLSVLVKTWDEIAKI